jgi:hypothetical protein
MDMLREPARRSGFMLALYDSVTGSNQSGVDVDMFAVPWRHVSLEEAQNVVNCALGRGFHLFGEPHFGAMGTYAVVLQDDRTRKILDLQFREVMRTSITPLSMGAIS